MLGYIALAPLSGQVSTVIELPNWQRYREALIAVLQQGETFDRSIESRLLVYSYAVAMFLDNPLFGAGTAGMHLIDAYGEHVTYAHNIFLDTAAELGLIGLVPLCVLFAPALHKLAKQMLLTRHGAPDYLILTILLLCVSLTVAKQFSGSLTHHKDLFIMLAIVFNFPLIFDPPQRMDGASQHRSSVGHGP